MMLQSPQKRTALSFPLVCLSCMPLTAGDQNDPGADVARCLAGRETAQALGQWNVREQARILRCLRMPNCDEVTECMRTP